MSAIRVLYVEDDMDDLEIVSSIVLSDSKQDFDIINEPTLEGAMIALAEKDIDIILLDLSLPDSIGIETVKAIKEACGHIPIIVISGTSDRTIYEEAVALGVYKMVHKDYLTTNYLSASIILAAKRYGVDLN